MAKISTFCFGGIPRAVLLALLLLQGCAKVDTLPRKISGYQNFEFGTSMADLYSGPRCNTDGSLKSEALANLESMTEGLRAELEELSSKLKSQQPKPAELASLIELRQSVRDADLAMKAIVGASEREFLNACFGKADVVLGLPRKQRLTVDGGTLADICDVAFANAPQCEIKLKDGGTELLGFEFDSRGRLEAIRVSPQSAGNDQISFARERIAALAKQFAAGKPEAAQPDERTKRPAGANRLDWIFADGQVVATYKFSDPTGEAGEFEIVYRNLSSGITDGPEEQYAQAKILDFGVGRRINKEKAFGLYLKAAERGHAGAQNAVGVMYNTGEGVTQDEKEAVAWFTKAALEANLVAMYNLGSMYLKGKGVPTDLQLGASWIKMAAERGDPDAQGDYGWLLANGKGVEKNEQEAVVWFRKAAEQGNAIAMKNLSLAYKSGLGVEVDKAQAEYWHGRMTEATLQSSQGH